MITNVKKNYPKVFLCLTILVFVSITLKAQERDLPVDTTIVSHDKVTIKGEEVPYKVSTGTQPVYGEDGKPDASLFYTYYERTDVDQNADRPIFISFNSRCRIIMDAPWLYKP